MIKQSTSNGQVQDVEIASSVAKAVLGVPQVVSLSPGHSVLAATYGPTHRVTGVVVRRSAPTEVSLEVHVVLRAVASVWGASVRGAEVSGRKRSSSAAAGGETLPAMAARIREMVFRTFKEMRLPPPVEVDVFIDDII